MNDWSSIQLRSLQKFWNRTFGAEVATNAQTSVSAPQAWEPMSFAAPDPQTLGAMLKDARPDAIDFTPLQIAAIKHLRRKGLVPLEVIANAFRIGTDRVLRVTGEAP